MKAGSWQLNCPIPVAPGDDCITLAHGEGGRLMRRLIRERIAPLLGNDARAELGDSAQLPAVAGRLAMSTDSFVVSPLFFPGGDIGSLAVYGTVNDLAVSGARPLWLTLAMIIEEGFPMSVLARLVDSVARAARQVEVKIVAGDTKVVARGEADGLFLNTTGVGQLVGAVPPGAEALCVGDEILVTGPIGRHGIAILAAREQLAFDPPPRSDSGPLVIPCRRLQEALGPRLRAMRDATRGGVAAVLHEWSEASGLTMTVNEGAIPVSDEVRGACELLGLDPLHVANEGTMVVAVEQGAAADALAALRDLPETEQAASIGVVVPRGIAGVTVLRMFGPEQPLDDPLGAPLPRIC